VHENERTAVAAHMHVLMRRRVGRVTDVEWMAKNREYALEIARLAAGSEHEDLRAWAGKLAMAHEAPRSTARSADRSHAAELPRHAAPVEASVPPRRYVATLR
jgi:hypothetical protein